MLERNSLNDLSIVVVQPLLYILLFNTCTNNDLEGTLSKLNRTKFVFICKMFVLLSQIHTCNSLHDSHITYRVA